MKSHAAKNQGYSSAASILVSGNQEKMMKNHASDSEKFISPFVSVTTVKKVAEYFASKDGTTSGYVCELKLPCDRVTQNLHNNKAVYMNGEYEDEWLVRNCIRPSEIVEKKGAMMNFEDLKLILTEDLQSLDLPRGRIN